MQWHKAVSMTHQEFKTAILNLPDAMEHVDESQYSLDDWCEALCEFSKWEIQNSRSLSFMEKMEYLSCCAEGSIKTGSLVSLTTLLQEYLKVHGVIPKA